mgnify:CR=1 FL=1
MELKILDNWIEPLDNGVGVVKFISLARTMEIEKLIFYICKFVCSDVGLIGFCEHLLAGFPQSHQIYTENLSVMCSKHFEMFKEGSVRELK